MASPSTSDRQQAAWLAQAGNSTEKCLVVWQVKYRATDSISQASIQWEIDRTARQAASWRKSHDLLHITLVYLVVGSLPALAQDQFGVLLQAADRTSDRASLKLSVPSGLSVFIPTEQQVEQLLGDADMEAFKNLPTLQKTARGTGIAQIAASVFSQR